MAVIEVIEHQKIKIGNSFNPDKIQITKKDAEYLRRLELNQDKQIFKWGFSTVSPQQWVGIITVPNGTIEILPKIIENDNKERLRQIFVHMLQVVHDLPVRKNITANLQFGTQGFLDILIFLFLKELEKQLKNSIYKMYQKQTRNLNSIKGTIDYPENLRKNHFIKNKFVCRYSIFTGDNLLNQIIRFTLEYLSKITVSTRNKMLIKRLSINFDDVTLKKITKKDFDKLVFHRNNLRYQDTLKYCELFFNGLALDLKSGEVKIDFMLFDMNQLFERYIYRMYKKAIINGKVFFQSKNHHLLSESLSSKKRVQLKPDLIISTPAKTIVLDTKWKNTRGFADEKDLYQINAYLGCIPNLKEGILLYPKSTKNDKMMKDYCLNVTRQPNIIKIRTVDLTKSGDNPAFFSYLLELLN